MHFRTHVKPESIGQSGRWQSEYHDAMIDHDKNVGTVLKALDDAGHRDNTFVMYSTDNGPHMNTWPDGGDDAVPQREELELGRRLPRALHGPLAGQDQAGHRLQRDRRATTTGCRRFWPSAGDADVKEKLLKGHKVGDMTYKVHLDGDNLVPYLTGQAEKSPRESFLYFNDDQQLTGLRYDNWKLVFMEQRARERCGSGPSRSRLCACPKIFNLRTDPYERADITSNTYYDWLMTTSSCWSPPRTTWASSW